MIKPDSSAIQKNLAPISHTPPINAIPFLRWLNPLGRHGCRLQWIPEFLPRKGLKWKSRSKPLMRFVRNWSGKPGPAPEVRDAPGIGQR
jgi:hypothetical protein